MPGSSEKEQIKNNDVTTFTVPSSMDGINKNISINNITKQSQEELINQAIQFHSEGKIIEAAKSYQACIKQGSNNPIVFYNYGIILRKLGKLKEAELSQRRAIELKPDFAEAHSNLGLSLIHI